MKKILELHQKWLNKEPDGVRADFSKAYMVRFNLALANLEGANLQGANLYNANLERANLQGANLQGANLQGANLERANLQGANLQGANLERAYLSRANLIESNLVESNLERAILKEANLYGANLDQAKLPDYQIPQNEVLTVYKKVCEDIVLKLEIPADAKRTASLVGNKCRCDKAKVIGWMHIKYEDFRVEPNTFYSIYDVKFQYKMGEYVVEPKYNNDPRVECTEGIHFFMDLEAAKDYK
jgi:hypothetical protein